MKRLIIFITICSLLLVTSCEELDISQHSDEDIARISENAVICNPPYLRVGLECCLDLDNNSICDRDEMTLVEKEEVIEAETDTGEAPREEAPEEATEPAANPEWGVPRRDRPRVELFIMSYCPYGMQMRKAFIPVAELLGEKIDYEIKFVNYLMHGEKDLDENTVQYCVQQEYPEKYLRYLRCHLPELETKSCLERYGMKTEVYDCVDKTEKEYGLTAAYEDKEGWLSGRFPKYPLHQEECERYGIRGSPTLIINGKQAMAPRSPEAIKRVICDAFTSPPLECRTRLSEEQTIPGPGPVPPESAEDEEEGGREEVPEENEGTDGEEEMDDEPLIINPQQTAIIGDEDAPVTIIYWGDYECPFTRRHYQEVLPWLQEEYIDRGIVQYQVMQYPFHFHANAQNAAEASRCALREGLFEEMHRKIFDEQIDGEQPTEENLKRWAKEIGLGSDFTECLENHETAEEVDNEMHAGQITGVRGTPAFLINRELYSGSHPREVFEEAIEEALG